MAGITRWNKTITPAGADGWSLTPDIGKALDSARVAIPVANQAERDGLTSPLGALPIPTLVWRLDKNRYETWDGTIWRAGFGTAYTPIWTGVTDFGTGGSLTGTYWQDGDRVTVRSRAKFGSAATIGTAAIYCPLPSGLPIGGTESGHLGTGFHVNSAGVLRPLVVFAGSSTTASVWSSQFPVQTLGTAGCTAAATEYIEIVFSYQTSGI
jgi:hypothetical protein